MGSSQIKNRIISSSQDLHLPSAKSPFPCHRLLVGGLRRPLFSLPYNPSVCWKQTFLKHEMLVWEPKRLPSQPGQFLVSSSRRELLDKEDNFTWVRREGRLLSVIKQWRKWCLPGTFSKISFACYYHCLCGQVSMPQHCVEVRGQLCGVQSHSTIMQGLRVGCQACVASSFNCWASPQPSNSIL